MVWFFFYATPETRTSVTEPRNPLSLRSFPERFLFIKNKDGGEDVAESTTEVTFATKQPLVKVWNKPASGQAFVLQEILREVTSTSTLATSTQSTSTQPVVTKRLVRSTSTVLMFVDRTTGHLYGFNFDTYKTFQISNTTIPGVYDAYLILNGTRVLMRYLDTEKNTITTVTAKVPQVSQGQEPKPLDSVTYLPSQVESVAVNKSGTALSYLVSNGDGVAIYTLSDKGTVLLGKTPFEEWTLVYGGDTLYAHTKPSAYREGYIVKLPNFEFITPGRTGLLGVVSDKNLWLQSMWSSKGLVTYVSDLRSDTILDIKTLASKCVWGENNALICAVPKFLPRSTEGLPDDWFQGRISFNDTLVQIDPTTKQSLPLYSFDGKNEGVFDVTKLSLSSKEEYVTFIKKQDGTLWLLNKELVTNPPLE